MRDDIMSTHDISFVEVIGDEIRKAYENEFTNSKSGRDKLKSAAKDKRSAMQNCASSLACLLTFITFESIFRRMFYVRFDKNHAHSMNEWEVYTFGLDHLDKYKQYFDELKLIRDIIAHGYLFAGYIEYGKNYNIVALEEVAVSGKHKGKVRDRTELLKIHTGPSKMSFMDAAKFYAAFELLMKAHGERPPNGAWLRPDTNPEWNDMPPLEWLKEAVKTLDYEKDAEWQSLLSAISQAEYESYDRLGKFVG